MNALAVAPNSETRGLVEKALHQTKKTEEIVLSSSKLSTPTIQQQAVAFVDTLNLDEDQLASLIDHTR